MEELERPKARERQTATQFGSDGAAPVTSTEGSPKRDDSGYTRTVVADALGMSTCRLDMKPSELVALGEALEELERPKAQERQASGLKQNADRPPLSSPDDDGQSPRRDRHAAKTDTIIGRAIGMSPAQYGRAKHVVQAAKEAAF